MREPSRVLHPRLPAGHDIPALMTNTCPRLVSSGIGGVKHTQPRTRTGTDVVNADRVYDSVMRSWLLRVKPEARSQNARVFVKHNMAYF